MTLSYPDQFNARYKIVDKLGEGAHGSVWSVLDRSRNIEVAMKFMVGEDFEGLIQEEADNLQTLKTTIGQLTSCFPIVYDIGSVDASILNDYEIMTSYDQESMRMGISGFEDIEPTFLTMPIYNPVPDVDISFLFELIFTIATANSHRLYHGDIRPTNIMSCQTDTVRYYTVNGVSYRISNPIMPVIIDWVNPHGFIEDPCEDLKYLGMNLSNLDPTVKDGLLRNDIQVLELDLFSSLREPQ
jgi:serine/threonine protein kinase